MKKPLVSLALTAVILSAGLIACQKYTSTTNPTPPNNGFPPDVMVMASIQGRVVDQDGVPVQGATVISGTANTSTDINGVFTFKNISLSSRFGYVKVAKSGFFTGSRSIATNGGASNFVTIQLIPRTETGNFPAASGGKIMVYTGDTVAFGASSIVNASTNAAYTGTVHVFATYLNPTNDNLTKYMPGDLRGIGTDGKEDALQSYGMMSVELQDDAGNKLQLASGQQATITMAIPNAMQGTAPATIPSWYFNDSTGRWMQQGSATRQGNNYVGNVGHFTWWNYDVIYIPHNFKAHIKDQAGNVVPYVHVTLSNNNSVTFSGYTDSTGYVTGWLPSGVSCQLQIVTDCGSILAGVNVGPALNDVDLGIITITDPQNGLTVTGSVVDCFNNPVANGYVNVYLEGLNYRVGVTNGQFTLYIHRCYNGNSPAQVTAGDLGASQQGSTSNFDNVITGTLNVGQLSACGVSVNQFITVTFNSTTYSQTSDNYLYYNGGTFESMSNPYMAFYLPGLTGAGSYTPAYFYLYTGNYRIGPAADNTLRCNVTTFGAVNQYVTGTISGNVIDSSSNTIYPLTGNFKLMRTN